ncbi:F-box only protein 47-like [Pollicipes pollicipes]|uniref:F-box only protein 47-like n=1 Tax=Pollicipes pollicipes TaxID=41117 RepID=UPI0018854780|nr:F-box only protein 47-like [Pollicipes pollicipes]
MLDLPIRKKPRRSSRLELKEMQEVKLKYVADCPVGFFDMLPPEIIHNVFGWLDAVDLSTLTVTSKSTRDLVEAWLATPGALASLLPRHVFEEPPCRPGTGLLTTFQRLGLLQKRSTCLYFTRDRLRILWNFVDRVDAYWNGDSPGMPSAVTLACYGRFLHAAIAGWEECECDKVFQTIEGRSRTVQLVERVLSSPPGAAKEDEVNLRLFYRLLYLDPCRTMRERQFWMNRILAPQPIVRQARLMYLLYGPRTHDEILWDETTDSIPHGAQQDLFSAPDHWLAENVACLLLLAGDRLAVLLLANKALNGRIGEVARLLGAICIMSHKFNRSQNWMMGVVQQVCHAIGNPRDRTNLMQAIWDAFTTQIMDLWDMRRTHPGERDPDLIEEDVQLLVSAHAEFGKVVLSRAIIPCPR